MKKLSLVVSLVCLGIVTSFAQRSIRGTVSDAETGEPLIGASILAKGTSSGTVTDFDGNFELEVPEGVSVLVVSYTGYTSTEVSLGATDELQIKLTQGVGLDEVVVTGLGIKRDKKALGYGVATLSNDLIEARPQSDVAKILNGKATGVNIAQTSGLAGSGTNIIIRGYSSITGSNQPLFVVDGAPLNTDANTSQSFNSGGATASSRFLDLDPNNIAEVNILKGLAATVLYGEAGRNGVILITTKAGNVGQKKLRKTEVNLIQSVAFNEIANLPDYQNTYGNGFNGNFGWFFSNWGPEFTNTDPSVYGSNYIGEENGTVLIRHPLDQDQYNEDLPQFIGQPYEYRPYESVENFFETGITNNTSLNISTSLNENTSVNASYSYLDENGFTPNLDEQRGGGASNFLRKHNFSLGASTKLANGFKLRGTFNYVNYQRRTPTTAAAFGGDSNGESGLFAALLFTPRSIDLLNLPYQNPVDGSNVYYRRGSAIENPLWVLNNAADFEGLQRFFGNLEASYEITPWLTALYRISIDQYAQDQTRQVNKGGDQNPDGFMRSREDLSRVTDQVANLLITKQLSPTLSLDAVVGFNARREVADIFGSTSTIQNFFNLFTHDNFSEHLSFSRFFEENVLGAYATATLGINQYLYLGFQGRNDWTSTLEQENRSIFYPSGSISFIPTELFPSLTNSNIVNYFKIRVGYGTSAGYPDPYQTRSVLSSGTNVFVTSANNSLNTNSVSNVLGNPNLEPERHSELELGIEARFLENRVGVDLSLYDKRSKDLIINLPLDPTTGFTSTTTNAAEISNKGIELGLNINPIRGEFNWDFTLNYTQNENTVDAILEGIDQVLIEGFGTLGNYAIPGQPYGVMQGEVFERDANGNLVVNSIGEYIAAPDIGIIGDPNPNYQANWINNFSWKGLSLSFQFSYQDGGSIYSSTVGALMARGNTVDTDFDRFQPIIAPGVKSDGTPNDIQGYVGDLNFTAYFTDEGATFDATNVRLREASLTYLLPKSLLESTPFGRVSLTISGQNLWYFAPNFPKGINFDPEVLSLGVGNGRGFDFRTAPTARQIAATLNLTF